MTAARDERRRLVEQLPDEQIPAALAEVQRLAASAAGVAWPPPWFGAVTSNRAFARSGPNGGPRSRHAVPED